MQRRCRIAVSLRTAIEDSSTGNGYAAPKRDEKQVFMNFIR